MFSVASTPPIGQTVADVRIGHERPRHRHRQQAGLLHLHDGLVFQSFAPLAVFDRLGAWRRRCIQQRFSQFASQIVFNEIGRVGDDRLDFLFQSGLSQPDRSNWK